MKHVQVMVILAGAYWPWPAVVFERLRHPIGVDEAPPAHFKATDPNVNGAAHLDLDQKVQRTHPEHVDMRQSQHVRVASGAVDRKPGMRANRRVLPNGLARDSLWVVT
jgi:hypothetical protein